MKSSIYTKLIVASSIALILSACGGSSSNANTTKEQAINHIETYAQNGGTAPTIQDYTNAGVTGVTTANIANINEIVENLTAPEVDTTEEIQNLVNTQGTTTPPVNQEAPVITINGKNPLYRQLSSIYTELGATATDAIDGPVAVTTTGNVDRHKVGTYTITYTAQDKEGHTSTATRKVIVQGIVHHGVSYGTVISPHTGKVWLDRNIGASEVCSTGTIYTLSDGACMGDTYQWGRNTDGHEKHDSPTTTKKGKTITDSGNKFVIGHHDWTSATNRTKNWAATDGRSVCPVNFRVPTLKELKTELDKVTMNIWSLGSVSFLKINYTAIRVGIDGCYVLESHEMFTTRIWTNTSDAHGNTYFYDNRDNKFETYSDTYVEDIYGRSGGYAVRCIQH